jgi:uncharacterized membrane protein YfcA
MPLGLIACCVAGFFCGWPMMLLGIFIGDRFHANMSDLTFKRLVGMVLVESSAALCVK